MNSNPALGLLGFWMMLQLVASLALLIGGIYALFCIGRAASGLDRLAGAMEDWVALQTANTRPATPQKPGSPFDLSTPAAPIPSAAPVAFTPQPIQPEYSAPNESAS